MNLEQRRRFRWYGAIQFALLAASLVAFLAVLPRLSLFLFPVVIVATPVAVFGWMWWGGKWVNRAESTDGPFDPRAVPAPKRPGFVVPDRYLPFLTIGAVLVPLFIRLVVNGHGPVWARLVGFAVAVVPVVVIGGLAMARFQIQLRNYFTGPRK